MGQFIEYVSSPTFDDPNDWTISNVSGVGWQFVNGHLVRTPTASSTDQVYQAIPALVAGQNYRVQLITGGTAGSISVEFGNQTFSVDAGENYDEVLEFHNSYAGIRLTSTASYDGTIVKISIIPDVDRTDIVALEGFEGESVINQETDTLTFYVRTSGGQRKTVLTSSVAVGEASATGKHNQIWQSFVATQTDCMGVLLSKLNDTGSFTGKVTVEIREDDEGDPAASAVGSVDIQNADWLDMPVGDFTAAFTASLIDGGIYWIGISTDSNDNLNHPNIGINDAGSGIKYWNAPDGYVSVSSIDLYFSVLSSQIWVPDVNDEVRYEQDGQVIFGGVVIGVTKRRYAHTSIEAEVKCVDYSFRLNRLHVVEQYISESLKDIVEDIVLRFTEPDDGFTSEVLDAENITVDSKTFDRVTVAQALTDLAELTGYQWYVDPDKVVRFFARNTEAAPFVLQDENDTYITDSMEIVDDFTQIRNRVYIRGGEVEGIQRTEYLDGDGTKTIFPLATKFAHLPTVILNPSAIPTSSVSPSASRSPSASTSPSSSHSPSPSAGTSSSISPSASTSISMSLSPSFPQLTVGVDFSDNPDDFDVLWSFPQKSLKFKTAPQLGTRNIVVTGLPLYPIVAQVEDRPSIDQYGVFEFVKVDTEISTQDEAFKWGQAQLSSYAQGIVEGQFSTYEAGLKVGQIININSTIYGINDSFVIQRVHWTMIGGGLTQFDVQLATLRTVGILQVLINLLRSGARPIADTSDETLAISAFGSEGLTISDLLITSEEQDYTEGLTISEVSEGDLDLGTYFVFGPYTPVSLSDPKRVFSLDGSRLG